MCKKNNFQIFWLFAIEMAILSVFFANKGLGPLEVSRVWIGRLCILEMGWGQLLAFKINNNLNLREKNHKIDNAHHFYLSTRQ